ncbi:MAG: LpqN/LpqT family lipoprotein [Mycobacterium sp.]
MRTVMGRWVVAGLLAAGLTLPGCSGAKPVAEKCETVSAPMTDIPTRTDQEPKLRIPVPEGWERATQLDSEQIRFAIRSPKLAADNFTPNAVVTMQRVSADLGKPDQILQAQTDQLTQKLNITDVKSTPTKVCGAPALSSTYTTPELRLNPKISAVPPRKATSLGVVYRSGDANYVATVTVQAVKADNPGFVQDSETILKGFQILPPH